MSLEAYIRLKHEGPTIKLNFRGQATREKIDHVTTALRKKGVSLEERLIIGDQAVVFVPEHGSLGLFEGNTQHDAMMDLIFKWMNDPHGLIHAYTISAVADPS